MPSLNETIADAIARGFTQRLSAFGSFHDLDLMVRPDADLDGPFTAVCCDTGHTLRVNGWLHTYEEAA